MDLTELSGIVRGSESASESVSVITLYPSVIELIFVVFRYSVAPDFATILDIVPAAVCEPDGMNFSFTADT